MKRKFLYSFVILLLTLPCLVNAQSSPEPVIYQDWKFLGENPQQIEIEYRIIKCSTIPQVHLYLFNENPVEKTVLLTVEITNNDDNQKITKEVTFKAALGGMFKALCDSDASLDALKVDVPSGYNPANLTVKITLKP